MLRTLLLFPLLMLCLQLSPVFAQGDVWLIDIKGPIGPAIADHMVRGLEQAEAAEKLAEAAKVLSSQDQAIQLRYLQTLVEIAGDKSSTIVFPLPMELMEKLRS